MQKAKIQKTLAKLHNGAYTNITFLSDLIPNKDNKDRKIQKLTKAVVRLGVTYSHINVGTIKAHTAGADNNKLPWGEWDPECSCLIVHKGNYYLRCTVSRSPKHQRKTVYLLDGEVVTLEQIADLVRPSELNRDREEYVFNPKIENILALGK